MTWVPSDFAQDLAGLNSAEYVFVKCLVCQSVFRWGIYGFQEGAINCPICGALTWNPKLVSKTEYLQWLQRVGRIKNLGELQQNLWHGYHTDEEQQRR
jgi:hypothetical protein